MNKILYLFFIICLVAFFSTIDLASAIVTVDLTSPANNTVSANTTYQFMASLTNSNPPDQLSNATLHIYSSSGVTSIQNISLTQNDVAFNYTLTSGNYTWNYQAFTESGVFELDNANFTLTITAATIDICTPTTQIGFNMVMLLASIAVITFCISMVWINWKKRYFNMESIFFFAVILLLIIILWQASGQNLGTVCPVR